jgi:hypothetical protein
LLIFSFIQNLLLEIKNLEEASKPSVLGKLEESGVQSTGIPVNIKKSP